MIVEIALRLAVLVLRWVLREAVRDTEPAWVRIRRPKQRVIKRQRYFRGLSDPSRYSPPLA